MGYSLQERFFFLLVPQEKRMLKLNGLSLGESPGAGRGARAASQLANATFTVQDGGCSSLEKEESSLASSQPPSNLRIN